MSTWSRKPNWLFKENAQVREDYLMLRQKWTEEIWNKEKLILFFLKSIESLNLKDWSFIKRINGQIRLNEKRYVY